MELLTEKAKLIETKYEIDRVVIGHPYRDRNFLLVPQSLPFTIRAQQENNKDRDVASTKEPDAFVQLKQYLQVKTTPLSNIKTEATLSSNFPKN